MDGPGCSLRTDILDGMGKRHQRRHPYGRGLWTTEYGGMPVWGIVASVIVMIGLGTFALVASSQQVQAEYTSQRPVPAFSFNESTPSPAPPTVLFIGDSYSDGAGASSDATRWTTLAATAKGWTEVNLAIGGTGYLTSTPAELCMLDACPPYPDVIRSAPSDVTPATIVISGGRNDTGNLQEFRAGVEATLVATAERFPGIPVYVTNPLWDDDETPRNIADKATIVQEVAAAHGVTFVDIGQPLAGHADFVIDDGIHPNDAGHQAIAEAFTAAMP